MPVVYRFGGPGPVLYCSGEPGTVLYRLGGPAGPYFTVSEDPRPRNLPIGMTSAPYCIGWAGSAPYFTVWEDPCS